MKSSARDWAIFLVVTGLLSGCSTTGDDPGETSTPGLEETWTPEAGGEMAVIATVADDYSVGVLAVANVGDRTIRDNLATISGDPAVVAQDGLVFQLNRYNWDSVRIYEAGQWDAPLVEFSVGDLANPQDVEICQGEAFITLHDRDYIGVYDIQTGFLVDTVDLSPFDDGDGSPEASTIVQVDGRLYVGLEQFDQSDNWMPAGGMIVEVDCSSRTVSKSWEVGPAPTLHENPSDPKRLLVRTGGFLAPDQSIALDGAILLFDTETGEVSAPLVEETALNSNLGPVVATENGHALFLTSDAAWASAIYCLNLETGEQRRVASTGAFLASMAINSRGEAWIAARAGAADPDSPGGIIIYDVDQCKSLTGDDWLSFSLAPFSLAFY